MERVFYRFRGNENSTYHIIHDNEVHYYSKGSRIVESNGVQQKNGNTHLFISYTKIFTTLTKYSILYKGYIKYKDDIAEFKGELTPQKILNNNKFRFFAKINTSYKGLISSDLKNKNFVLTPIDSSISSDKIFHNKLIQFFNNSNTHTFSGLDPNNLPGILHPSITPHWDPTDPLGLNALLSGNCY